MLDAKCVEMCSVMLGAVLPYSPEWWTTRALAVGAWLKIHTVEPITGLLESEDNVSTSPWFLSQGPALPPAVEPSLALVSTREEQSSSPKCPVSHTGRETG